MNPNTTYMPGGSQTVELQLVSSSDNIIEGNETARVSLYSFDAESVSWTINDFNFTFLSNGKAWDGLLRSCHFEMLLTLRC